MSTDSQEVPRPLPDRPNFRHLKDQAKDLLKAGGAERVKTLMNRKPTLHRAPLGYAQNGRSLGLPNAGCRGRRPVRRDWPW